MVKNPIFCFLKTVLEKSMKQDIILKNILMQKPFSFDQKIA